MSVFPKYNFEDEDEEQEIMIVPLVPDKRLRD